MNDPAIDVLLLGRAVWERIWIIIGCGVIGIFFGIAWAWKSGSWYEVVVITAPNDREISGAESLIESAGLAGLIGLTPPGRVKVKDEAIATLTSRNFLYSFITDLDLMPEIFGSGARLWRRLPLVPDRDPTLADAYEVFIDDILSVAEKRKTGLIEITVRWDDPEIAATWARELIARLNLEMQSRTKQQATREMEFLKKELERTDSVQVRQAIFKLVETQMKTLMLANVSDDFALRVIDPPVVPDKDKPINLSLAAKSALGLLFGLLLGTGYSTARGIRFALLK